MRASVAAIALLGLLFAVNLYRAATQSITCDEAFAHNQFLVGPWSGLVTRYDASHHVLHTVLSRISVGLFGLSEFTLRLPSLLGGLLYFVTVFRLSRFLFGRSPELVLSVAVLSLNPFLLDHLSAARGYGLGLAFWVWALFQSLLYLTGAPESPGRLVKAGAGLALAVASNLTLLFPSVSLAVVLLVRMSVGSGLVRERVSLFVHCFLLPAILIGGAITFLPLSKAEKSQFYVGVGSLVETSLSLASLSFFHHPTLWMIDRYFPLLMSWTRFVAYALVPLVLGAALVLWLGGFYQLIRGKEPGGANESTALFVIGGATLGSVACLIVAHNGFGILYPTARTGLYLIVRFSLTWLVLLRLLRDGGGWRRAARVSMMALLTLSAAWFVLEFNASEYAEWRFDAGTKRIVEVIRQREGTGGAGSVRIGASWVVEPSLNFYRRMYGLNRWEAVPRGRLEESFDYFVLAWPDQSLVEQRSLTTIFEDPHSGTMLAAPGRGN